MKIKDFICDVTMATSIILGVEAAQAATISLLPMSGPVPTGGQSTFSLVADFGTTSVLAGGTDFTWDSSVLSFQSFTYNNTFATLRDPVFDAISSGSSDPWDLQSPNHLSIAFGNFAGISMPDSTVIGTLIFNAVAPDDGSTLISLSDSIKWSGYFDTSSNQISVDYTNATAVVSAVPLPVTSWLLVSGVVGMVGLARRGGYSGSPEHSCKNCC